MVECYVPPRFLGLQTDSADDEEKSEEETGSSTMEWEVCTVDDEEPQRRLLPHEFESDPVFNFRPVLCADDENDAISYDSHISGVEDPEERSWVEGVDDKKILLNDGQIDENLEKPRVTTTLDLDKPDHFSRLRIKAAT